MAFLYPLLSHEAKPEIVVGLRKAGFDLQAPDVLAHRFVQVSLQEESIAHFEIGFGVIGFDSCRFEVLSGRLRIFPPIDFMSRGCDPCSTPCPPCRSE